MRTIPMPPRWAALYLLLIGPMAQAGPDAQAIEFVPHTLATNVTFGKSVYSADLDDDGDIDLLSGSTRSREDWVAWYENLGGAVPVFAQHLVVSSTTEADAVSSVFAKDVDGDGNLDILSASVCDDKVAWYKNDGGTPPVFTQFVITEDPNDTRTDPEGFADGPISVYAADLDGDEDVDVMSANYEGSSLTWFENDGGIPPTFTPHLIIFPFSVASQISASDFDKDGDIDVLATSEFDGTVAWFENSGTEPPAFTKHEISTTLEEVRSAIAADMDSDGDLDILTSLVEGPLRQENRFLWFENVGDNTLAFQQHEISARHYGIISVQAADLDNDGDLDALEASVVNDEIVWYENDGGSPPGWTEHVVTEDDNPFGSGFAMDVYSIHTTDVDGDGDIDIVFAAASRIGWFENRLIANAVRFDTWNEYE